MSNHKIIDANARRKIIDWQELKQYRDLFVFLIWRDLKIRYAQSVLGIGWAVIQPVFTMLVFTLIFGNFAKIESDGVPYAIFSYTALVPWIYFATAFSEATNSLGNSTSMVTKIYFPRIILPLTSVFSKLVDFGIALTILVGMMFWFGVFPSRSAFFLPIFVLIIIITAAGAGMWMAALGVQYRDVRFAGGLIAQILMYLSPVVYPASSVPSQYRLIYAINPLVGVIEGFRSTLLQTTAVPWDFILIGSVSSLLILLSGLVYFQRMEIYFADVI